MKHVKRLLLPKHILIVNRVSYIFKNQFYWSQFLFTRSGEINVEVKFKAVVEYMYKPNTKKFLDENETMNRQTIKCTMHLV